MFNVNVYPRLLEIRIKERQRIFGKEIGRRMVKKKHGNSGVTQ
jgi:hypothetical protein